VTPPLDNSTFHKTPTTTTNNLPIEVKMEGLRRGIPPSDLKLIDSWNSERDEFWEFTKDLGIKLTEHESNVFFV